MRRQDGPGPTLLDRRGFVLGTGLAAAAVAASGAAGFGATDPVAHHPHRHRHHDRHRFGMLPRLTLGAGGMIQRAGVTFRTGGVNAFQLITDDYPSPRLMTRREIDSLFAKAAALDASVIRAHTLAASVGNPGTLVTGVSGSGPNPTIHYDPAVWRVIDYAVWRARQQGLYLIAPFVDEWGYYHGGKRSWVDFRYPGTASLDPSVKSSNSATQRAAEDVFYQDQQVRWDFQQYVRDWLGHVNRHTGVAFKDEPALSVVQVGNELWTAAQDAPGWVAETATLIKSIAPTTLVMDSGADGLAVQDMAWAAPEVDILETHPYTTFGAAEVAGMATFAAAHGKAFAVGEYPWSAGTAPALEATVRRTGNVFTSALWSLQNNRDRHNDGAAYGSDDVSFYVPGKDAVQQAAVQRVTAHHRSLIRGAATATSPALPG